MFLSLPLSPQNHFRVPLRLLPGYLWPSSLLFAPGSNLGQAADHFLYKSLLDRVFLGWPGLQCWEKAALWCSHGKIKAGKVWSPEGPENLSCVSVDA